ncbi:MAG TPA: hypothetical protein VEY07_02455 [Thermoplasmata archaeon]|nr:hypothetical protein [Thermoplasmata archaeon]
MTASSGRSSEAARLNRCRCGHFPGSHMRVVPLGPSETSSFRLEASGPCVTCGAAACPKYQGVAPVEPPP